LQDKTSLTVALLYGLSSYTIYYVSSGLKETIFTLLVVLSFYFYLQFNNTRKNKFIFLIIFFISTLLFFRVPVAIFILSAISFTEFFYKSFSSKKMVLLILVGAS